MRQDECGLETIRRSDDKKMSDPLVFCSDCPAPHQCAEADECCAEGFLAAKNEIATSTDFVAHENQRLRAALQLIDDYYQTGGDLMSHVSHIAQAALAGRPFADALTLCGHPDCPA